LVSDKLSEIGLEVNIEKSKAVSAVEGFKYLGFDIKHTIDGAIQSGDFALAEKMYEVQACDVNADAESVPSKSEPEKTQFPEYEAPVHIENIEKQCHIVSTIINKAKMEKYLGYPDKTTLLQLFHCLGKDGAAYIHHILSFCSDYDYAETQRHIKRYPAPGPVGCKKLAERYDGQDQGHGKGRCICNFSQEKIYPTPIIHALRIKKDCFVPSAPKDAVGHFKGKTPQHKAEDALSSLLTLNKKAYEIQEQQNIFKGQIESLFERTNIREFQTPQGLLVKTDDGIFIKVG